MRARRDERLRAALGQVRAAAGPSGVVRILMVDPGRKAVVAPVAVTVETADCGVDQPRRLDGA
ncbi:MAG: hypothetical protein ACKOTH_10975, partial [Solirubrobacterales bacterium]